MLKSFCFLTVPPPALKPRESRRFSKAALAGRGCVVLAMRVPSAWREAGRGREGAGGWGVLFAVVSPELSAYLSSDRTNGKREAELYHRDSVS